MSKEAMTLALEALERADKLFGSDDSDIKAVNALKEALALPNEKPMHPEIKKMYEDFFDKCFAESFDLNKALEEALAKQEQCTGCEGFPAIENNPCAVCGKAKQEQGEPDWKDMYEKEKRRSAMWIAKYEKDIGPLERATPQQEQGEPVAWELRKGKTDRVLLEITNNPERAHSWKASLEEVVPLYTKSKSVQKPLTEDWIERFLAFEGNPDEAYQHGFRDGVTEAEAAHGIKE
jgi:hypothetical protein